MKFLNTFVFAVIALQSFSQCNFLNNQGNTNTYYPRVIPQIATIGKAQFLKFAVKDGGTKYQFNTCSSSYNTQLTGYNSTNTGTSLFYNNNNGSNSGNNACSGGVQSGLDWISSFSGTLYVQNSQYNCNTSQGGTGIGLLTYKCIAPTGPTIGTPGNGVWNVYCWDAGDGAGASGAWSSRYSGYYTNPNFNFNTATDWTATPYNASNYKGCFIGINNHSWSATRTGWPCGNYQIDVHGHDTRAQLFINGIKVWDHGGCCDSHIDVWNGVLRATDVVTFRGSKSAGNSNGHISITKINPLTTGTINGIDYALCVPSFNRGTMHFTGYNFGNVQPVKFQWMYKYNNSVWVNIAGATGTTFNPYLRYAGVHSYRARLTDGCQDTVYSNIRTDSITGGTISKTNTLVCEGGTTSFTTTPIAGTFLRHEYRWDDELGVFTDWGSTNPHVWNPGTPTTNGRRLYVRGVVKNSTCTFTTDAVSTYVFIEPESPVLTKSPNLVNICAGVTLTANSSGGQFGYNCYNRYRYNNGSGWSLWNSSIPTFVSAVGINRIQSQRFCSGGTCSSASINEVNWNVQADPIAPTISKIPNNNGVVCVGATLSISVSGGSGGAGVCINQYRTYNGSWSGWSTIVPSFTAVLGINRIQSRRTCNGLGCNSNINTVIWNVTSDPVAPTILKNPNVTGVCVGTTLSIWVIGGSGGAGVCTNQYRTYNGSWSGWSTIVPSFTAVLGPNRIQSRRTCNGSGCNSNINTVSWYATSNPVAPIITKNPNVVEVCVGTTLTISTSGGNGGTGACSNQYRYSTDNGSIWSAWLTSLPSFTSVLGVNRVQTRRSCGLASSGCGVVIGNEESWVVGNSSVASSSATTSSSFVCSGDNITLTVIGGTLGTGATWEWYSDLGLTTNIGSGSPLTSTVTSTNTYYVRAEGCDNTSTQNTGQVVVNGSSAAPLGSDILATTTSSFTCKVDNSSWHYFYNSAFELLGAINSHGIDLGNVTIGITVGDVGTYGVGLTPGVCGNIGVIDGELILSRHWDITTQHAPGAGNLVDVIFYYKEGEVVDLTNRIAALTYSADYINCWGDVQTDADIMMTVSHTSGNTQLFSSLSPSLSNLASVKQIQFQLDEFSAGILHSKNGIHGLNPLPVKLLTFEAQAVDNKFISVAWETATEINNNGFDLLRSIDGVNFEKISWVKGKGNSNIKQVYSFKDYKVSEGIYYYKLRQIDFNGEFEEFYIVSARISSKFENSNFIVKPVPTNGSITIILHAVSKANPSITIYDYSGKKVLDFNREIQKGSNNILINEVSHLSSGVYYLRMAIDNNNYYKKIIIQKK